MHTDVKVGVSETAQRVEFGSDAHYHLLIGDENIPMRTGIQTSEPGYVAPMHAHPYTEFLFIIEGEAEAWLEGEEDAPVSLKAGDCIALPPNKPHSFRTVGDKTMRLLGIHHSSERIVDYKDQVAGVDGYPVLDENLEPVKA